MQGVTVRSVGKLVLATAICSFACAAQGVPLNLPAPQSSTFKLEMRRYVQMPAGSSSVISMTTRPDDTRLYVTTQDGRIHAINPQVDGYGSAATWFNVGPAIQTATGRSLKIGNPHEGLQSTAFHPDFANVGTPGYGKFYTTLLETKPVSDSGHNFLGNTSRGPSGNAANNDSVLVEWTYNHTTGEVDPDSYRELFRVKLPVYDHMIKQARFNLYARPGDEDYGLLYLTHGDSSSQESTEDRPLSLNNALGKMLRIDPLDPTPADPNDAQRYAIPSSNPFVGAADPNVLQEVYAYGFRNPHTFSFNPDDSGNVRILAGDIGRNNVEEINLVLSGHNYGWTEREGTFVHLQGTDNFPPGENAGYEYGVGNLPLNEASVIDQYDRRNTYPIAQYGHNSTPGNLSTGNAVASGFVIQNGSDPNLHNQLIFNNFANHDGIVYRADFNDLLSAVTTLDPEDPSRDEPSELTQAPLYTLRIDLDTDNNPATPPQEQVDMNDLLNDFRNDARYGEGVFGEMYISTKRLGGQIYLVTNSLPLPGDYNKNRIVDAADYTVWRDMLGESGYHLDADGNGDGKVDAVDYGIWKDNFGSTWSSGGGGFAQVAPEPAAMTLLLVGATLAAAALRSGRA